MGLGQSWCPTGLFCWVDNIDIFWPIPNMEKFDKKQIWEARWAEEVEGLPPAQHVD